MSFLDQITNVLSTYQNGGPQNREAARQHYDEIARNVPEDDLASIIGPALGTLGTDQVEERVKNSATEMTPQQRGGFLGTLLGGLGGASGIGGLLSQIGVSPSVAQNPQAATPEEVGKVAAYAHQNHPAIFEKAMGFYAQHPMLVKILGTMAIAAIARNLQGGFGGARTA